mgnify:CR=1 FL=1
MQFWGRDSWIKHLDFMLIDMLIFAICNILSFYIKFGNFYLNSRRIYLQVLVLELFVFSFIAILTAIYSKVIIRDYFSELKCSFLFICYSSLTFVVFSFLGKFSDLYSRQVFLSTIFLYLLCSPFVKQFFKYLLKNGYIKSFNYEKINLVVICDKNKSNEIIKNIKDGDHLSMIHIVKYFDSNENYAQIYEYVNLHAINEVLIACNPSDVDSIFVKKLVENNITIHISINDIFDFYPSNTYMSKIGIYHTIGFNLYTFSKKQLLYLMIKRIIDILASIIGLAILMLLMIIIKTANLITHDKGPLIYKQIRIGKNGKQFELFKFRSMSVNADEQLKELLKEEKYRKEWEQYQKLENDPRITKVGKFLRKTSLDEFPQFINIFKGDMSLVGPRPLVPNELESHGGIKLYEKVKPGLTSWWAANGRSLINYNDRLELEYYYVKNTSLWLDFKCILKTFGCLLTRKGAE